jgi:putative sugar O-methyltransferase
MMLKRVIASALQSFSSASPQEVAAPPQTINKSHVVDGSSILRLGDELFDKKRFEDAESTYRRALNSDAPPELVAMKLQRVVAKIVRDYDAPEKLLVAPGDGRATVPPVSEFYSMLDAVNKELATVPEVMPSKFWVTHATQHIELLVKFGLHNFKRTVAHNYYNWLTISVSDKQIARLLELWPVHGSSEALADEMEDMGTPENQPFLKAFNDVDAQRFYKLGVSLLWDYTLQTDHHGLLRRIAEPVTGNPLRITRRGRLLSQDLAHSVRERNQILDASGLAADSEKPIVIAELGAGHGRLAHMFSMSTRCKYMIFDITPALLVSQWYITSLFPDEKIFRFRHFDHFDEVAEELSECRFAFFSSSQLEKFPQKYFDLFINVCSLMEMRMDTINYFFREIDRVTRGYFYTKQWLMQKNREDNVVIERDDYPVPQTWKRKMEGIDPINQRLFEEVWEIR